MKEIKLAYSAQQNAGDLMNVDIVEKLSGCKVTRSKTFCADMTAIGGALVGLQYDQNKATFCIQKVLSLFYGNKPIYIWGSGFIHDYNDKGFYRHNLKVCALRGVKTQDRLEKLTGKHYDVPLGDAGLLIDVLMTEKPEKKYKVGLIPHMTQQNEQAVVRMSQREDVHFIDIRKSPQEVAREIAECETIASTSLHGLVFSDALHVPNMHVTGEKEIRGGAFKFEDYYSAFGLEDKKYQLSKHLPSAEEIIDSYQINPDDVEKKKKDLMECFPKF